jgi:hypothetical protein
MNEGCTAEADAPQGVCPTCDGDGVVVVLSTVEACPDCDGRRLSNAEYKDARAENDPGLRARWRRWLNRPRCTCLRGLPPRGMGYRAAPPCPVHHPIPPVGSDT